MNTQTTRKHYKFNRYGIGVLTILVIAAATFSVLFIVKPGHTEAAAPKKPLVGAAIPSQLTFSGVNNWWQGATNKTSVALFSDDQTCFVSVQHITGSLSAKQAKDQATLASLTSQGHTVMQLSPQSLSIKTNTGTKQYQLQQVEVTNPSDASASNGSQIEGGQESAYIPLSSNDFLYIEGDCNTSAQLATTPPVLQAVSFDANKVK